MFFLDRRSGVLLELGPDLEAGGTYSRRCGRRSSFDSTVSVGKKNIFNCKIKWSIVTFACQIEIELGREANNRPPFCAFAHRKWRQWRKHLDCLIEYLNTSSNKGRMYYSNEFCDTDLVYEISMPPTGWFKYQCIFRVGSFALSKLHQSFQLTSLGQQMFNEFDYIKILYI